MQIYDNAGNKKTPSFVPNSGSKTKSAPAVCPSRRTQKGPVHGVPALPVIAAMYQKMLYASVSPAITMATMLISLMRMLSDRTYP